MSQEILPTESEWIRISVQVISNKVRSVLERYGECFLGFSGGSTPKPVYTELGKVELPWDKVDIFLVDERVTLNAVDMNSQLVRNSFLLHAHPRRIVFPDTSLSPELCAAHYDRELHCFAQDLEKMVLIMGMGPDGHIASLFPPFDPNVVLERDMERKKQWAQAQVAKSAEDSSSLEERARRESDPIRPLPYGPDSPYEALLTLAPPQFAVHNRVTITSWIAKASACIFLMKGQNKKTLWEEMLADSQGPERWPAKVIPVERLHVVHMVSPV